MKTRPKILVLCALLIGLCAEAQLLDELKKRAKKKGLETREVSYDSTLAKTGTDYPEEKEIKAASDFFTMDVVMQLYDEDGNWVQTFFFDKETIAMRMESKASPKPAFQDRNNKMYMFNQDEGQYETMSLLPPSSMGFMMAGMIPQFYLLPQEPYLNAFEALANLDIAISFLVLEIAFVYKPFHFEADPSLYAKSISPCGGGSCTKFSYTDPEYMGSYIVFDAKDKLREFYISTTKQQPAGDNKNQTGKFVFSYKPVTVELPDAVEQSLVPGPLGEIIPLEKGLEPWKHNKKDKQRKKDN